MARVHMAAAEGVGISEVRDISSDTIRRVVGTARNGREAIDRRLKELDEEWDVQSFLKLQAVTTGLKYAILGALVSRKYYLVLALVGAFALQQKYQGNSLPYKLFRKMGKRRPDQIEEERVALKYVRGDFDRPRV